MNTEWLATQAVSNISITIWRVCLVTRDINHMDCHKPYQPYPMPMVCYKPYNTDKQVYAQRLSLHLHNAASTIAHSHWLAFTSNSLHRAKRTHRDQTFKKGGVVDSLALKYRHIFKNGQQKKFSAKRPSKTAKIKPNSQPTWNTAKFPKFGRKTANLATLGVPCALCSTWCAMPLWRNNRLCD